MINSKSDRDRVRQTAAVNRFQGEVNSRMTDEQKRRLFQRIKGMTNQQFYDTMDILASDAYGLCEREWREAIFIALPPRYRKKVEEAVEKTRGWDGITVKEVKDDGEPEPDGNSGGQKSPSEAG